MDRLSNKLLILEKIQDMVGLKIRMIREMRGYSQEYMAEKLGMAQNSYSRIETNQTKLSTELLQKIATILGVSPMDILSQQPAIINLQSNQGTQQAIGHVDTIVSENKELYAKILEQKDSEIQRLQRMVEALLEKLGN